MKFYFASALKDAILFGRGRLGAFWEFVFAVVEKCRYETTGGQCTATDLAMDGAVTP